MFKKSLALILLVACVSLAATLDSIALPTPDRHGGKPLMQALNDRKSAREFAPDPLSQQVLSNLLWAAFGVNRPDGHRTAPSANNRQTIDIYVVTGDKSETASHPLAVECTRARGRPVGRTRN